VKTNLPCKAIPRLIEGLLWLAITVLVGPWIAAAEEPASFKTIGDEYEREIRPLMRQFCLDCHSTQKREGELDLGRFAADLGGHGLTGNKSVWRNFPLIANRDWVHENIVLIGDARKFISALVTLDADAAARFADANSLPAEGIHEAPALIAELQSGIEARVNSKFARVEHIRKFTVLPREFTQEDGELTPTLKIKRRVVNTNWGETIEAMYQA